MFCQKCGAKLTEGALFCTKCGNRAPVIKNVKKTENTESIGDRLTDAVRKFQSGNKDVFDIIYNESKKYVYYTILKSTGDKEVADDIMQETYLDVYKSLDQLQNAEAFKGWAAKIAQHKISRYYQKKNPELFSTEEEMDDTVGELTEDDTSALPEDAMINKEVQRLISEIIDELPQNQKSAVISYYYNQMSIPEIAQSMDVPESTVKTYLFRGKKKIKDGVLEIEQKHGTKLYALPLAGLLGLLFTEEAKAAVVTTTSSQVIGTLAAGSATVSGIAAGSTTVTTGVAGSAIASAGSGATTSAANVFSSTQKSAKTISQATVKSSLRSSLRSLIICSAASLAVGSGVTAVIMHNVYEQKIERIENKEERYETSETHLFDFDTGKESKDSSIREGHYLGYTDTDTLPWKGGDFYFSNGQWRIEDDFFGTKQYQYTVDEINGELYLHYWNDDDNDSAKIKIDGDMLQIFDDNYLEWHTFVKQ